MSKKNVNIIFSGDLSCTGIFHEKVYGNQEIFDTHLLNILKNTANVVCNFEGPATDNEVILRKDIQVKSPKNSISYLKARNINIFNLANNHIFDAGLNGFSDTIEEIKKEKGLAIGAGNNISEALKTTIIDCSGISIGLIAICDYSNMNATINKPGINAWKNIGTINKTIKNELKECDWIVLNFHGGEEYTAWPSPPKRKLLKKIARKCEVDIIIAHHSHCFQKIEKLKNKLIFYSLGNFVFDIVPHQQFPHTLNSNLVELSFSKNNFNYKLVPIYIDVKNGLIKINKDFEDDNITNLSDYKRGWQWEAYNVLFNRKYIEIENIEDSSASLQKQSFLKIVFRKKFYSKSFQILKDKYNRSLYIAALIYKLKNYKA